MMTRFRSVPRKRNQPSLRAQRAIRPAWLLLVVALAWPASVFSQTLAPAGRAAIASAHPLATRAGHEVLEQGGNAFDAAVAIAAVLAVVEPYSSGLGGGGFWLLHRARDGHQVMVDSREVAPRDARPELYFDVNGSPIPSATRRGGKAVAVPGVPAALVHISERYGSLPLSTSLAPAIRHARQGFAVGARFARIVKLREDFLRSLPEASRIFLDGNEAPRAGFLVRQPRLADTLETLSREGHNGFYRGAVAHSLLAAVNNAGGVWQPSDLERYRVIERAPLVVRYRDATITTVNLPSAGGVAIVQALQMLERFELNDTRTPRDAHLVVEALRRAFHDRALYLGDNDVVDVSLEKLLSRERAARLASKIESERSTPSETLGAPQPMPPPGGNTTHLSVIDAAGNRVAATLTINLLFGSGIVAPEAGVLLNNEMDDFSLRADVPNAFRLIGGSANAIAPGKRPLSSMTPTFVDDAKGMLVIGAPGGSRIVSQMLLAILDYVGADHVDLAGIVSAPRYHHQWWPDRVEIEPGGFTTNWRAGLETKGHRVRVVGRKWGNMQAAFRSRTDGSVQVANDPRGAGVARY